MSKIIGFRSLCFLVVSMLPLFTNSMYAAGDAWRPKVAKIRWVDYSPPSADPNRGVEATPEAIRKDLLVLRKARFTGLVTYASSGVLGRQFLKIVKEVGFKGVIIGVWNPQNDSELDAAVEAAKSTIVLGICVGNEGLMNHRYTVAVLAAALNKVRAATGKPVTTTETIDRYDDQLMSMGDWVFPNVHPYFANVFAAEAAVEWTVARYQEIRQRSERFVLLKEVGLPTAGDPNHPLSEKEQCTYYDALAQTKIYFVYFEAFDQQWKTNPAVEPHWGIFRTDRSPKILGRHLAREGPC